MSLRNCAHGLWHGGLTIITMPPYCNFTYNHTHTVALINHTSLADYSPGAPRPLLQLSYSIPTKKSNPTTFVSSPSSLVCSWSYGHTSPILHCLNSILAKPPLPNQRLLHHPHTYLAQKTSQTIIVLHSLPALPTQRSLSNGFHRRNGGLFSPFCLSALDYSLPLQLVCTH